jgi:hypothetical protein
MLAQFLVVCLSLASITTLMGCDPTRTTHQSFEVNVTDVATGKPAVGVSVHVKYD